MSLLELSGSEFAKYLETVKFSAAQTPENLALHCIRIVFGKEKVYFVSTDSYRLLYLEKKMKAQFERAISLPVDAVNVIIKLLKDKIEQISLELSGDNLLLLWEDTYFSCRLTAVPYPNFQTILSQNAFDKDRKSTRLNSSHANISYAVFCLKKKKHNKASQFENSLALDVQVNMRDSKSHTLVTTDLISRSADCVLASGQLSAVTTTLMRICC